MKHIFALVALMLICGNIFAISWEDTPHLIGDAAVSFAGEPATQAVGDTIYIAYLSAIDDNSSCLNFTKSNAGNNSTHLVMDYLEFPVSQAPGAPSLLLDLPRITILVKGEDCLYRCLSEDYGRHWTCQRLAEDMLDSNDPYPLLSLSDAGVRNFTVNSQAIDPACMYFVNDARSTNGTNVYFRAIDVVDGPLRTNTDLCIKQVQGGSNDGWPTFIEPVTLAGEVISLPPIYPLDDIFQGGLIENTDQPKTNLPLFREEFVSEALPVGPLDKGNHILLLEVDGDTASGYLGILHLPRRDFADMYHTYPSVDLDPWFRNHFGIVDTLWTPIAPFQMPEKLYTEGTLWLKGTFSGQRSIYCASDIYLIGDILLSGTAAGESPLSNSTDKISLISDKQIIVKYGYVHPADSLRYHPNCGPHQIGGIRIYADLIALHKDPDNPQRCGVFTFEYQHPHPSIPAWNVDFHGQSHYFDRIDLHRRHYPQTAAHPWPPNIDYPWYNPLWPERMPYKERGVVRLWGSLYQERTGYIHRSGHDSEYPSNSGIWDIENDLCGGYVPSEQSHDPVIYPMMLGAVNYPGTGGEGVGYYKDYHYDSRSFADMPSNDIWGLGALISESNGSYNSVIKRHKLNEPVIHKSLDRYDGKHLYHLNNTLFTVELAYPQNLPEEWEIVQAKLLANGNVLTLQKSGADNGQTCRLVISGLEPGSTSIIHESPYTQNYISLHRTLEGFIYVIPGTADNTATLIRINENGEILSSTDTLPLTAGFGAARLYDSRIVLSNPEAGILHAVLWAKNTPGGAQFWHRHGFIYPISVDDPAIVPPALSLNCYPNPFAEMISLEVKSPISQQVKINIYNVKGQKVKTLQLYAQSGTGQITWNGNDEKGKPVAQGVYFARIADAEHTKITKILRIK